MPNTMWYKLLDSSPYKRFLDHIFVEDIVNPVKWILRSALLLSIILFVGCTSQEYSRSAYQSDRGKRVTADSAMVSSAHPLASEAGLKMLRNGGNAVDAAVATAFALNVVEPNMSGIGGGGSMLIWKQKNKEAVYLDFYSAKLAETYREVDHSKFDDDEFNLLPTGIPGTVDGLLQALKRHGSMNREEVMAPAIKYANEGFPVYPTLAQFIRDNEEKLSRYEGARNIFWPDGKPLGIGEILRQPALARTLQQISDGGAEVFYQGEFAEKMVQILNKAGNPVTLKDFAQYEPQWDKVPLRGTYKGFTVLSAPLPQTGFFIIQALNMLENYDLNATGLPTVSAEAFNVLSSTMRLSIADRIEFVTDPNWKDVPVRSLISKEYADQRRTWMEKKKVPGKVEYGDPAASKDTSTTTITASTTRIDTKRPKQFAETQAGAGSSGAYFDEARGTGETTHISIVDSDGNAVSLSTTLSPVFGSGAWVNGFILNRSGYNFSNMEEGDWQNTHPYRIRASTISPTIILDENNEVRLVIGAPGGGRIPTAVLQNILYILEYNLDPLDAVEMPRIFPSSSDTGVQIEKGFDSDVLKEIRSMGYNLQILSEGYARLYLVYKEDGKLIGVADPRHDGEVRGF